MNDYPLTEHVYLIDAQGHYFNSSRIDSAYIVEQPSKLNGVVYSIVFLINNHHHVYCEPFLTRKEAQERLDELLLIQE